MSLKNQENSEFFKNQLCAPSVPRATLDIDINIWCEPTQINTTLEQLFSLGVSGDLAKAKHQAEIEGVAYLRWHGIRLDIFFPSIDFYQEALQTRVRLLMPHLGATWILSAESLAVFKLLFFRPKDLLDVEKLVQVRGARSRLCASADRLYGRRRGRAD